MIKQCLKCGQCRDVELFNTKSGRVSQWMSYCKECAKVDRKTRYAKNKDKEKVIRDIWYAENRHKKQAYEKEFRREHYKKDSTFRIGLNLRVRLGRHLKQLANYVPGNSIAIDNLGCSINKLKMHMQMKFHRNPRGKHEYMTWDNNTRNGWHVDHMRPLSSFDLSDPEQLKIACHYTNLQPMWAEDNLKKGDKYE